MKFCNLVGYLGFKQQNNKPSSRPLKKTRSFLGETLPEDDQNSLQIWILFISKL